MGQANEENLQNAFNTWILELSRSDPLAVERWYKITNNDKREPHAFGEAFEDAFCAVEYDLSAGI